METEQAVGNGPVSRESSYASLYRVTVFSKYLALALFVSLPFLGGYVGYVHAPEKVVEVERIVRQEAGSNAAKPKLNKGTIATTSVDMGEYRIRYDSNFVTLIDDRGEVLQIIPWNGTFLNIYNDTESLLITNWDFNYDHYLDVGILTNIGYGGVNLFYHLYTFNPKTNQLERMRAFDTFEPDISNVVNPDFDIAKQTILMSMRSAQQWRYAEYHFANDNYELVGEWAEGLGAAQLLEGLDERLQAPDGFLEQCRTNDVFECFGSGRQQLPDFSNDVYAVYALVHNDAVSARYGILERATARAYILEI